MKLFLSHKAIKDFLIAKETQESWSPSDIEQKIFGVPTEGKRSPQSKTQTKVSAYANSIFNGMLDYILDKIKSDNLPFDNVPQTEMEEEDMKRKQNRLEPMAYFLFKLHYDNDRRYGVENLDKFDDFSEFLPITTK